jgi:hypothetical protein
MYTRSAQDAFGIAALIWFCCLVFLRSHAFQQHDHRYVSFFTQLATVITDASIVSAPPVMCVCLFGEGPNLKYSGFQYLTRMAQLTIVPKVRAVLSAGSKGSSMAAT